MPLILKHTIQCLHPELGITGCWAFLGDDHRMPGTTVSPVYGSVGDLLAWTGRMNWQTLATGLDLLVPETADPVVPVEPVFIRDRSTEPTNK